MSENSRSAEISDQAIREAAEWFARLQSTGVTDADRSAFRAWLAMDRANHDAFSKTKKLWHELAVPARIAGRDSWHRRGLYRPTLAQRAVKTGAALSFAFLMLGSVALWRDAGLVDRAFAEHATSPGEHMQVVLPDGSTAYLDGDSALDTDFKGQDRSVAILRGRVWFDVVRDESKPFRVTVNEVEVRVLGTAFAVEDEASEVKVTVERGLVAIAAPGLAGEQLTAGEALSVAPGQGASRITVDADTELAWRRGLIVMNHTPLAKVIDELGRISAGRIIVRDESLRDLRLSGVFKADEPETILAALHSTLGLRTFRVPGIATVIYR
ncbi:FecR family protein [Aminobacter aminovorans]|uniref:Fec operon regulator FecR n=1 Tax=Aminobacter aminovorans TaxID=83263 RepID=A0A380WRE6_AMIAI|nr:FecR family protein [Aminobacter aminovorans]TCS30526.1 FecR family protein [Aminobacter aminovorans]SUU91375.1 fec operon regulator FecR [Aminobacter aminovorans]